MSLAERSIMAGRDITGDITTYEDHHWDYDPTGLQGARGFARVLLVVSLLLGVAGFGFFGYSIVGGLIAFGQDWAAQSECREQFGLGEALFDCLDSVGSGGLPFEVTPWIPIGAVLFFASIVLQVAGRAMNRNTDEHHRPGSPPRPGP